MKYGVFIKYTDGTCGTIYCHSYFKARRYAKKCVKDPKSSTVMLTIYLKSRGDDSYGTICI